MTARVKLLEELLKEWLHLSRLGMSLQKAGSLQKRTKEALEKRGNHEE